MTCITCARGWTFGQAFLRSLILNGKKNCPHCGARQYVTRKSRRRSGMVSFTAFVVFLLIVESFQMRLAYSLVLACFILMLVSVVNPLVIQLFR